MPRSGGPIAGTVTPLFVAAILALGGSCTSQPEQSGAAPKPWPPPPPAFEQRLEGSTAVLNMVLIPAGSIEVTDPKDGGRTVPVGPFYIATTETTWDLYDLFVFGLDEEERDGADAVTRPSKPYIPPDRGFGHAGYPAISMTAKGARDFCAWLSVKTGRTYRLPTELEWEHACREDAAAGDLSARAWFKDNAGGKTHPVAQKKPSARGVHDLLGNVAEWAIGTDGEPVACGGSYLDPADALNCSARARQTPDWNSSDPQFPKSQWWLADCTFVGFRVACEVEPQTQQE